MELKVPKKIEYTVWRYDFETAKQDPILKYVENMRKEEGNGDEPHYACQAMLSFYVRADGERELTEDEFLD